MAELKHTPEPWRFEHKGNDVTEIWSGKKFICYASDEDAKRIVGCVNDLAKIPTEELGKIQPALVERAGLREILYKIIIHAKGSQGRFPIPDELLDEAENKLK